MKRIALDRRTFLRASGTALALPVMDAMTSALARGAAAAEPPRRLLAIQTNLGIMPHLFFPQGDTADYEPSPYLSLLEPVRRDLTVFSGLSHPGVDGGHANEKVFLTGAPHPAGAGFRNSVSLDQVAAEQIGAQTRFASLVLNVSAGNGSAGMSFTRAGVAIPAESSVAALYKKLFIQGSADEIAARVEDLRAGRSLLDTVRDRAGRLNRTLPANDRRRLDQYFTSIRELEQQLLQAEAWEQKPKPQVELKPPQDVDGPALLIAQLRMMYDLIRLAFETDSTRVVSLYVVPLGTLSGIAGVEHETHSLTHHGNRPEMIDELRKIEEAQFKALGDLLLGLRGAGEKSSHLLDRTSVLYGTCMGNANGHTNKNWPMLLAGGGFRHGKHLAFDRERNYPIANLFVTMLQRMGLETDRFSSSTGTLRGLEMT